MKTADRLGVRFTFFLNLGFTFNWKHTLRHVARKQFRRAASSAPGPPALPTLDKLGAVGVLETMLLNPRLGRRFRKTFDRLFEAGHELGLHGGTDHALWQRALADLTDHQLDDLLRPAYDSFTRDYGKPPGFASPGFHYDDRVLRMTDGYGFEYGSDMAGERPFRPRIGGHELAHYQVPVNVAGEGTVPLVEQMLALGRGDEEIVEAAARAIRKRDFRADVRPSLRRGGQGGSDRTHRARSGRHARSGHRPRVSREMARACARRGVSGLSRHSCIFSAPAFSAIMEGAHLCDAGESP